MWWRAAAAPMACSGLTVRIGATLGLPAPPVEAVPASGPISAIDCSRPGSSGSAAESFLSRTVPASASDRAAAASLKPAAAPSVTQTSADGTSTAWPSLT